MELHGLCGAWGGIAAGIFGQAAFGGIGGVSAWSQAIGTGLGLFVAVTGSLLIYGFLKLTVRLRLDPEAEFAGADLTIHRISASPEKEAGW
jgi:Amt family ammonium transporter